MVHSQRIHIDAAFYGIIINIIMLTVAIHKNLALKA